MKNGQSVNLKPQLLAMKVWDALDFIPLPIKPTSPTSIPSIPSSTPPNTLHPIPRPAWPQNSTIDLASDNRTNKSDSRTAGCRRKPNTSSKCYHARTDPIGRWAPRISGNWACSTLGVEHWVLDLGLQGSHNAMKCVLPARLMLSLTRGLQTDANLLVADLGTKVIKNPFACFTKFSATLSQSPFMGKIFLTSVL